MMATKSLCISHSSAPMMKNMSTISAKTTSREAGDGLGRGAFTALPDDLLRRLVESLSAAEQHRLSVASREMAGVVDGLPHLAVHQRRLGAQLDRIAQPPRHSNWYRRHATGRQDRVATGEVAEALAAAGVKATVPASQRAWGATMRCLAEHPAGAAHLPALQLRDGVLPRAKWYRRAPCDLHLGRDVRPAATRFVADHCPRLQSLSLALTSMPSWPFWLALQPLASLRQLQLSCGDKVVALPYALPHAVLPQVTSLSLSVSEANDHLLFDLNFALPNIQHLSFGPDSLQRLDCGSVPNWQQLQTLDIGELPEHAGLMGLHGLSQLYRVSIALNPTSDADGVDLTELLPSSLRSLTVDIAECQVPDSLWRLRQLTSLTLHHGGLLEFISDEATTLTNLQSLTLAHMPCVNRLPWAGEDLPCLRRLSLIDMPRLWLLPLGRLDETRHLTLLHLENLPGPLMIMPDLRQHPGLHCVGVVHLEDFDEALIARELEALELRP